MGKQKQPDMKRVGRNPRRGGGKKMGRAKGSAGLPSSLLKAIGESERKKASAHAPDVEDVDGDVYEYEEGVPEEEAGKNRRYDDVELFDYELPSDYEDEEIDEEAAFGEDEDDPTVHREGGAMRSKEIDLNSDEESEDEDEMDNADDEQEVDSAAEDSAVEGEEDGEEEEGEEEEDEDEDEASDVKHRKMIEAVTGKSATIGAGKQERRGRERVVTEAYPESEFNLNPPSASATGSSGITVEDLMTPLHGMTGFSAIRKRMEQLQRKGAPVEAPLPRIIQDRVDRKAGYEKTSEDVTKWQDTVKRNREAPTLIFNRQEPAPPLTTSSLAATFKPVNDFEKQIDSLLRESKVANFQDVAEAEALELNKLTVSEVRERQERLAKMRNLLFRQETKAKRVKKIKSKTYHRLLQKDQKSKAEADAAVAEVDPEAAKAAAMKREFKRAKERMTLKHKNSSRWAKRILKRGFKASENDGTKDAVAEQLRTHAELTRKIHSAARSDSDTSSSDDGEGDEEVEDEVSGLVLENNPRSKVLAKAKVATLKALEEGKEEGLPATGLFSLPFMARAIARKKKDAEVEATAFLEQLEQAEDELDQDEGPTFRFDENQSEGQKEEYNEAAPSGRVAFGQARQQRNGKASRRVRNESADDSDAASKEDSDEEDVEAEPRRTSDAEVILNRSASHVMKNSSEPPDQAKGRNGRSRKVAEVISNRSSNRSSIGISQNGRFSAIGVQTVPATPADARIGQRSNQVVSEELPGVRPLPVKGVTVAIAGDQKKGRRREISHKEETSGQTSTAKDAKPNGSTLPKSTFSDGDDSDTEAQGVGLLDSGASQQDLIRQAFAGDDVETEFTKTKSEILEEEVPKGEGPVSLPGWGQWTHVQKKHGQPAWLVKEQEAIQKQREDALRRRKDANLKHVILSEKQDRKAAAFASSSIPFPFKSREVFESSIRLPIGRDFNTDKAYRDMIRPAVIKSAGVIIDPIKLDKSSVEEKNANETAKQLGKRKPVPDVGKKKTINAFKKTALPEPKKKRR